MSTTIELPAKSNHLIKLEEEAAAATEAVKEFRRRVDPTGEARSLDVKRDVHDAYCADINARNKMRTWGASSVNSWYKNEKGHVTQNWPGNLIEYWQLTRAVTAGDYNLSP